MRYLANDLTLGQAAMFYALLGHKVFPCRVGGKEPLIRWVDEASYDLETVSGWWAQWPKANIGLPMGDGWAGVDLDIKGGQNGPLSFELAGGPTDHRWPEQMTPSGGMHHLLMLDGTSLGLRNVTRKGTHGGIDLRVDRGYILASPSRLDSGGRYAWLPGGDPSAPIPDSFMRQLVLWSQRSSDLGLGVGVGVTMPTPSALDDAQVQARIEALGEPHTAFLRTGVAVGGDRSAAAYTACYVAFARGWTLADMARIGPETALAFFGANPPHGAAQPWPWCWRYTVVKAWSDVQSRLQGIFQVIDDGQKDAADGGSGNEESRDTQQSNDASTVPTVIGDVNTFPTLSPDEVFAVYRGRAEGLPRGDFLAMDTWLKDVLVSGLPEYMLDGLYMAAKGASGFPLTSIHKAADHHHRVSAPVAQVTVVSPDEVFVRSQDKFWVKSSGEWVTKSGFGSAAARDNGGDPSIALDNWLHGTGARCEIVERITYHPGLTSGVAKDERGVRVWNKYRPSGVTPMAGDIGPWLDLLSFLRIEGGTEVETTLMDEAAYVVQHPGTKLNHGTLLGGAEGIGKDSWLSPVLSAVGLHNVSTIHGEDLASDFQGWLSGTKVLVVNEMHVGPHKDRMKIEERLKPLLASPPTRLHVNEKNLRPYEIPNLVQVYGMTNHRDALCVQQGTRRYFPVWCGVGEAADAEEQMSRERMFRDYWDWLERGNGRELVMGHLLQRSVSHINPGAKPMQTEWLKDMILMARDPLAAWLVDQIDGRVGIFANTHVSAEDIATLIDTEGTRNWRGIGGSTPQRITKTLVTLGIKKDRIWVPEARGYRQRFKLRDASDIPSRKFVLADVVDNVCSLNDRRNRQASEDQAAHSWM